jgi:sterol O-acyltransferase
MFAPTLVYRDTYPRTRSTNWSLVATYFAEIIGSIIYTYCLFDRFCVPVFRSLKIKDMTWKTYVHLISISIMPGALMQLMIFFALLHCWHNAFAEILRFGDRQFYLDWWNSTSYNVYYRTWNTLVHDWLHSYIYQDLYRVSLLLFMWTDCIRFLTVKC